MASTNKILNKLGESLPKIEKLITVVALAIVIIPLLFVLIPKQKTASERIKEVYDACNLTLGSPIKKPVASGYRLNSDGSEFLISDDGLFFFQKTSNKPSAAPTVCLWTDDAIGKKLGEELYKNTDYTDEQKNGGTPSEFRTFEIDDELNGVTGMAIGANNYVYIGIYPKEVNIFEATYNVCSTFYSKYGDWDFGYDDDGTLTDKERRLPTESDTTIDKNQLKVIDKGKTLYVNTKIDNFTWANNDNLARCVSGMLDMPSRIKKLISQDGLDKKSTGKYSWGDFEADAFFDSRNVELTIYNK